MTASADEETVTQTALPSPSAKAIASETNTPKVGSRKTALLPSQNTDVENPMGKRRSLYSLKQYALPQPRQSSKCPLFCCFYAEFDNKVGPKVCYQSPHGFMELEIDSPIERMEDRLDRTFEDILHDREHQATSEPTSDSENSIFNLCSEYIITGNELTGKIINLSANNIHVLSRPTMISNERYERNSLLFCVGFVLRRTVDTRPFRPLLNKWAVSLQDLELEGQYLSTPSKRHLIQGHLERLLLSLNSPSCECSLLLNEANVLNLKLFHPPKVPTTPVPEHAVPVFLRRDRQISMYDWDLAINWVSLHIDGVTNARQISVKAEVDMEMVLSCLRVLRHHGVIALVDMFFFTNRYECTENAASLVKSETHSKLLDAAALFVCHQPHSAAEQQSPSSYSVSSSGNHLPEQQQSKTGHSSPSSLDQVRQGRFPNPFLHEGRDVAAASSFRLGSALASMPSHDSHHMQNSRRNEHKEIKSALTELYLRCHRGASIGDVWVNLLTMRAPRSSTTVDWNKMFYVIDHRRFATFGLVHGLLRRVHNFPLLVDADFTESERQILFKASRKDSCEDDNRDWSGHSASRQRLYVEDEKRLALRVASLMDGRHCDDELVCEFERSLDTLLEMVQDRNVVCIYAPVFN